MCDVGLREGMKCGTTYKRGKVLPAVSLFTISRRNGILVPQHKSDLDDPGSTSCHKCVPKNRVHFSTEFQSLRMRAHSPSGNQNDNAGDEVSLGCPIPFPRLPHSKQPSTPPNYPHARMLQVILNPRSSPTVFCESIHATPCGN